MGGFTLEAITLSTCEYTMLAGVLGASTLIGVSNPFSGLLSDEIRIALDHALESLVARDWVAVRPDNRVLIAPEVGVPVSICAFPEAVFILTRTFPGGHLEQHYFCATRQGAVRLIERDGEVWITPMGAPERLVPLVKERLSLSSQPGQDVPDIVLSQELLAEAHAVAFESGASAAEAELTQGGVDPTAARHLGVSLASLIVSGSIVTMAQRGNSWKVDGLGVIASTDSVWHLRHTDGLLTLSPRSAAKMKHSITRLMNRVLPRPSAVL